MMKTEGSPDQSDLFTLQEIAEYAHVTVQAVYKAIREKGVPAQKINKRWFLTKKDYDAFRASKYNGDNRSFANEKLFDLEKGTYSVSQVQRILSHELKRPISLNKIYYLLRTGQLRGFRRGPHWIIGREGLVEFIEEDIQAQKRAMVL